MHIAACAHANDPLDHPAYRLYRLSNPKLKQYNRNQHEVQLKAPWTIMTGLCGRMARISSLRFSSALYGPGE